MRLSHPHPLLRPCTHASPAVSVAHKIDPSLPAGDTSYDPSKARYMSHFDNAKSKRVLGLEYRTIEECTRDSLKQFKELGWY